MKEMAAGIQADGDLAHIGFSVVIPTFNRPQGLVRCLESLTQITFPRERLEIFVIDDGSRESLEPFAARFRDVLPIEYHRQQNAGPAAARNRGLFLARQPWVIFLDDDCRPRSDWLEAMAKAAQVHPGAVLGGRVINALPDNVYAEASQLLIEYLYEYYRSAGKPGFFTSNNLAFPTEALQQLGGFDTGFPLAAGEDRELCDRWARTGGSLVFVPDAVIFHEHALTCRKFLRQHFNYGRGAYQFHKLRGAASGGRMEVEPLSFYRDLLSYPLRRHGGWKGTFETALFTASQAANVAGFLWQKTRSRPEDVVPRGAVGASGGAPTKQL